MSQEKQKNIVLFVSNGVLGVIKEIRESKALKDYRLALIYQEKAKTKKQEELIEMFDVAIKCNLNSNKSITESLKPWEEELLAVTCRGDVNIPAFQKIIPHLPYLRTPTTESLGWSTNKLEMRKRFSEYSHTISPKFMVVKDAQKKTLKTIKEKVGFPLIIKPIGLGASLLVSLAFYQEELEVSLKKTLRKIQKLHKELNGRGGPEILVEQFIDGKMYSVDAHISSRGKVFFNPFIHVKTGKTVGFDDFFAYQQITPSKLGKSSIEEAQKISIKAIRSLKLRNVTAHIELLQTENGWKVIEIGPRVGGYRPLMYKLSYGIDITTNDVFVRIPKKVFIPKREKGHTVVLKYYAKKEGTIKSVTGIKKVQKLKSYYNSKINKKAGEKAVFAKHGGKEIFRVILFNENRSDLLADIRRSEQLVKIMTDKN